MISYVDESPISACWNLKDSLGMICVHCNCCSNDMKVRYKARIDWCNRYIKELEEFNYFSDDELVRKAQEKNIAEDMRVTKEMLEEYLNKLKGLGVES